jgi:hypothetical protein
MKFLFNNKFHLSKNSFLASGGQLALNTRFVPLFQRATCAGWPLVVKT